MSGPYLLIFQQFIDSLKKISFCLAKHAERQVAMTKSFHFALLFIIEFKKIPYPCRWRILFKKDTVWRKKQTQKYQASYFYFSGQLMRIVTALPAKIIPGDFFSPPDFCNKN